MINGIIRRNKLFLSEGEIKQVREELYAYAKKSAVKIVFNDPYKDDNAD